MSSESIVLISVIVLGFLSAAGLIALAVVAMRNARLAESIVAVVGPALVAQRNQTESVLAGYGAQLKPINDLLLAIKGYVDSADDAIYQAIAKFTGWPAEVVAAVGAKIWAEAEDMTDGDAEDGDPALVAATTPGYDALPTAQQETIPADQVSAGV